MTSKVYKFSCNREIDPASAYSPKLQLIDHRIDTLEASWRHAIPFISRTNSGTSAMSFDNSENRFLLCGNSKGDVTIVDFYSSTNRNSSVETYPRNYRIIPTRSSHEYMVNGCEWYPVDSSIFLTSGMDKRLKIWDATQLISIEEFKFSQQISNFHWSVSNVNSSSLIALAISSSNVIMLDPRTGSSVHQIRAQNELIWSVRWLPSGNYILATGSDQGIITNWDVRSGKSELKKVRSPGGIEAMNSKNPKANNRKREFNGANNLAHHNRINCLQSSNDGRFLLSLTQDRNISLWEPKTLKLLSWMKIPEPNSDLRRISTKFDICDEGRSLWAFVPLGNEISIVRFQYPFPSDGNQMINGSIRSLHGHFENVISCAYRKNYQQLISSSTDRFNLIWAPKMDELQFDSVAQNIQQLHEDAFSDEEN